MFRYNPAADYQPNGGRYLRVLSGKDLYIQTMVLGSKDTFPARFPNIFVDYPLGQMLVGDELWTQLNKAPMRLWQAQLNFAVWCASSACGVSSAHMNYNKDPMIRAVYCFHVYYLFHVMDGSFFYIGMFRYENRKTKLNFFSKYYLVMVFYS